MSTRKYGIYDIGYEGLESSHTTGIPGLAADAFRNVNRKLTICDNLILTTPEQS